MTWLLDATTTRRTSRFAAASKTWHACAVDAPLSAQVAFG